MSQAIIEFCEQLKTTLLNVEDRLQKAKESFSSNAENVQSEAQKHIDEASALLTGFRAQAEQIVQKVSAEIPEKTEAFSDKAKSFSAEAQVALRHAAIFMAEAASKGADGAAAALKLGALKAQGMAENLRHKTAVTVPEESGKSEG